MEGYAHFLLGEMRQRDPLAKELSMKKGKGAMELGLEEEGEFVGLLRLTGASASCNVMSLLARQGGRWVPTLVRGTPARLAEQLTGPLQHLWRLAALMHEPDEQP